MELTACRHPMHDEQTFKTLLKSHFFRQAFDIS